MKMFQLTITTLILRFYLLMGVVLIAGFTGIWWLALISLPIFISAMAGVTFKFGRPGPGGLATSRTTQIQNAEPAQEAA